MLTVRGLSLLASAVLLWLVGRVLGVDALHVVAVAAAALVVLAWLSVRLPADRVAVRRALGASRLAFGGRTEVELKARRDGWLPAPTVLVADQVPAPLCEEPPTFVVARLPHRRAVTVGYDLHGARRGRFWIGPVRLGLADPFGLARRTRALASHEELVVYPCVEALPDSATARTPPARAAGDQHRVLEQGDEFHTMREYVQGDDLRRVHWPSTARQQKLMVRQHELPWHAQTTLLLDTRAEAHRPNQRESFETAVSAIASVGCHLAARHHHLRLATEVDCTLPGVIDRQALLDRLAVVAPSDAPTLTGVGELVRNSGGEGMMMACVAPPPGSDPVAVAPDTRALLHAGRRFRHCAAIVVGGGAEPRADELVALLASAGWRSVALAAGQPLAQVWPTLVARRNPTPA